jgi:hypothetical protein
MGGVQHDVELAPLIYYGSQNNISIQNSISCSDHLQPIHRRPVCMVDIQPDIEDAQCKAAQQEGTRRSTTYSGLVFELDCLLLYLSAMVVQVRLRLDGPPEIANNVFLLRADP